MRKLLLLAVVAVVVSLSNPARAQFCPGVSPWVFDDVQASDPFCGYITWMAQNGISLGCAVIDANHRLYCPTASVTRAAMAAFMNRLGNIRVEVVDTGPGLTGGPITNAGTINLATTQLLPTTACASGQVAQWSGSAWVCANVPGGGSGTVTSVGSGTGLTGGPIIASGTLSIAAGYQLPQSCTNGQVPKSNGAGGWTCAADNDTNSGGTVTSVTAGSGLTGGTITTIGTVAVDTSAIQARVSGACPVGSSIRVIAANGTVTCQTDTGAENSYVQGGNAFGAAAVLGTTDNNAVDMVANNGRVMRYEPDAISPNRIGGSPGNSATAGVRGATIGGGGASAAVTDPDAGPGVPNRVTDIYGTVGGGFANVAGNGIGAVSDAGFATVAGGLENHASNHAAAVLGGQENTASGDTSAILGGFGNTASGIASAVLGGVLNTASAPYTLAAGRGAKADKSDCFVFSAWSGLAGAPANCLGTTNIVRFMADRGFSVDYHSSRPDGGGTRWVYIGDALPNNNTISVWNGAALTDAGVWANASDRALKEGFAPIDPQAVLEGVIALPVTRWRYRTEVPGVSHIGPTAQDFKAAFGLGSDDRSIGTVDSEGVALAAIQGLNAKLEAAIVERDARIDAQAREIADLKRAVEVLLARRSPEGAMAAR